MTQPPTRAIFSARFNIALLLASFAFLALRATRTSRARAPELCQLRKLRLGQRPGLMGNHTYGSDGQTVCHADRRASMRTGCWANPRRAGSSRNAGLAARPPPQTRHHRRWPCRQKAMALGVSLTPSRPRFALNHWRSTSTRLTNAMGVPHTMDASFAILWSTTSAGVSRIPRDLSVRMRANSSVTGSSPVWVDRLWHPPRRAIDPNPSCLLPVACFCFRPRLCENVLTP